MVSRPGHHARTLSHVSIKSITPSDVKSFLVPLSILLGIAAASATQTELAHALVVDQKYNQPYFTFFLTHITFALVCPIHLVILTLIHRIPISVYLDDIRSVISHQLGQDTHTPWSGIAWKWMIKISGLTWLISIPALSWFVAMLFTSALDVTAIYASSAFFAYFFSMILLKQPLSRITLGSIALAFAGVLVISLAGEGEGGEGAPSNRSLGDIVMLFGAILLGLYEVVYKMALPDDESGVDSATFDAEDYEILPQHHDIDGIPLSTGSTITTREYPSSDIPDSPSRSPRAQLYPASRGPNHDPEVQRPIGVSRKTSRSPLLLTSTGLPRPSVDIPEVYTTYGKDSPPILPTALHSNFITSCIGFATLVMLCIPIPFLHWTGVETFRWPGSQGGDAGTIWYALAIVAACGAIYNAGLMVLIGIWGPTTSSVANLLTIGLVAITDAVWIGHIPDIQTLCGVAMICVGFGVLLWEGEG